MASYLYPEEEDPEGAFSWWLSPCGGTKLVPDEIKEVFGILSQVADGVSSFVKPKKIGKGTGKKGDNGNPHDQSNPRSTKPTNNNNNNNNPKKCNWKGTKTTRMGAAHNTLRMASCNKKSQAETLEYVVSSLAYGANAPALQVKGHCSQEYAQACYHYSSVIRVNPSWATLTCHVEAATTSKVRQKGKANAPQATAAWYKGHVKSWRDGTKTNGAGGVNPRCQADEFPPFYLLDSTDVAWQQAGKDSTGQLVRYLPGGENSGAANTLWKSLCFAPPLEELDDKDFAKSVENAANKKTIDNLLSKTIQASITVPHHPEFTIDTWGQAPAPNEGLELNPCWARDYAPKDPGFALLDFDPWYNGQAPHPWDYSKPYKKGTNGD
jgi:hypothetical protein